MPIVGQLFLDTYVGRPFGWSMAKGITSTFLNGTKIPVGQYRILLRILRVLGDPTNERDYDVWLSPIVNVVATK